MKKTIAVIAITFTFATASIGLAFGPMHNNYGNGSMTGNHFNQNFTADQQKKIEGLEQKYQQQLTEKEKLIRTKSAELDKAIQSDTTTIGRANQLRSELYTLEQEYWTLRTAIDQEVGKAIGTTYRGTSGWQSGSCSWHNNHRGMTGSGHNEYAGMHRGNNGGNMNYGSRNCRW